jgi:hypothetical protein
MTLPLVVASRRLRRWVLLNHAGWSLASQPCGMPSRHYTKTVSFTIQESDMAYVTYILNDVTMITNKEEGTAVEKIELHPH